jgi:hypothetical protein
MPRRPDQPLVTYKCEGCGRRAPAPAPYGGWWQSACSEACLAQAIHRADQRATDPRLLLLVDTPSDTEVP